MDFDVTFNVLIPCISGQTVYDGRFWEVAERAPTGENIIIQLPTVSGKTYADVYVAKRHLETTPNAKVAVLDNKIHKIQQQKHVQKYFHSTS